MNNGQKSLSINETFIVEGLEADVLSACTGFYTNALISCTGNTQILLSNNIIEANSAFSATTFYGDGSNLTGISTQDTFVTGGTYNPNSGIATFTNNTGGTFSVSGFYTGSTDIYITGVTFSNNLLSLYRNDGVILGANINSFTSLTVNGSVSATTFYGDGSNLTGISTQDTFVTGGTYSAGTAVFTNNTGGTFNVSGFTIPFTGGTVTGATFFNNGLSANTFSATTYLNLPKIKYVINVAKEGGDFTSIKDAVDSILDSSEENRYVVKVAPGRYVEDEILLQGKEFVSVVGTDILETLVVANSPSQNIFTLGNNNELSFMTISGATSGVALSCIDMGGFSLVHKISIYDCDINVLVKAENADSTFYGEYVDFNGEYSYGTRLLALNGLKAYANMENYYSYPSGTGATIANHVQGSGATLSVFVGDGIGNGVSGSTNYQIYDYASLNTISTTADNWDYGIRNLNIGGPSRFDIDSYSVVNSISYDLSIEHPGTFGTFGGGSASHTKINNLSNSVYWAFLDIEDGEFDITRKISVTFQDGTHTDASTLIFEGSTMGLISGGVITYISGLTFQVSAGFGYLEKTVGDEIYMRIDWPNTLITLSPNVNEYLYFNENEILSTSGIRPSSVNNIVLGRVVTNSTGLNFIDDSPMNADHTSNRFGNLFREALGPIYAFGSIVTEGITPFTLNVTDGEYYYSSNEYKPIGGSGLTFTQYYTDGVGGWNTSATTLVNNTQFDNNGVLSGLTASAYTKHTLYVVGDGVNEKYMLVLGQNQYATLVETENALLPTPPTYFNDSVSQIANLYIRQGSSNIIEIEDIRPVIGFKAGGINASSLHANLLGLTSDDHKQYLLVDGSRAMSNNLNMGGNAIVSALTVNGVTVESHASRHKNGGADEIASATPAPSEIPKADTFGKLDGWISDASTTVKGLTRLSHAPLSASTPIAVGVNDPRFQNSITGVTNVDSTLTFYNVSGGSNNITLPNSIATSGTTLYSKNPSTSNFNTSDSIFLGSNAGSEATGASNSNFLGLNAGSGATSANDSNFFGNSAGYNASSAQYSNFLGFGAGADAMGASNSNFLGPTAGELATNAYYSNFFGAGAGQFATNAQFSNFIGNNAGQAATSASQSNFFGQNAGFQATDASYSNFIGQSAGYDATYAQNSNFFGQQAGYQATNAFSSNFLGSNAGNNATNAAGSNFFGASAGNGATDANNSNFFGVDAGVNAANASDSNFFGTLAGYEATSASDSNFLGQQAGYLATNATQSNFIGKAAGENATDASGSNFLGTQAGSGATSANNSNFLGEYAGFGSTNSSSSNFFGRYAGSQATNANDSNFLGRQAGESATSASYSNFFGFRAGNQAISANTSNFIGNNAGNGATYASFSNFIGSSAGGNATNASYSNFFGQNTGVNATGASYSTLIGFNAGYNVSTGSIGSNNIIIGTNISFSAGTTNSINIGGVLFGINTHSTTGGTSSVIPQANGRIGIGVVTPTKTLHIYGESANDSGLRLERLTSASPTSTGQAIGVDSNGNVVTVAGGSGSGSISTSGTTLYSTSPSTGNFSINNSIFLGSNAGRDATGAEYSIFLGPDAGNSASGASYSNFLGYEAGEIATNAFYSNFIGNTAGRNATNANNSNFFGWQVGLNATNASHSTFFGQEAGRSATNASGSTFIGRDAGGFSTNANNSNFLGFQAGYGATNSNNSNFLGFQAGESASSANASNFLGPSAGRGATSASQSNFLGDNAGRGATGANQSNFLGVSAGSGATSASESNFMGNSAGRGATSAFLSNFLGSQAGVNATNASHSNFFSQLAGSGATNASFSNFIGLNAGRGATSANNSNFLGQNAGRGATSATNSNFIGQQAGSGATSASNSNFLGEQAGSGATNAQSSNFLGLNAGRGATGAQNSNFFGNSAGIQATNAFSSNFLGSAAGGTATNASSSNFFGSSAGNSATNANSSNFFGGNAGESATNASFSNFLGGNAGNGATNASFSNFFGREAGRSATGATNSNFIGLNAGRADVLGSVGSNNIIIGTNISLSAGTTNSINLGGILFGTGTYSITGGTPSISAQTSGRIGIGVVIPTETLHVSGNTRIQGGLSATTISATTYQNLPLGSIATSGTTLYSTNPSTSNFSSTFSIFLGSGAGQFATNASNSNFIGFGTGFQASSADNSNFIGTDVGTASFNARYSNFIGVMCGRDAPNASYSTFLGYQTGRFATGSNNIIIGTNISFSAGSNSINIGGVLFGTGTHAITAGTPSFSAQTNGRIGIGVVTPQETLHVSGNTRIDGVLSATTISATTYLNLPPANFTGGTVTGPTNFINGLTATTISATTYQNLPLDIIVTGGTYSDGTATFTNNSGGTFNVTGLTTPFTGGTVNGVTNFTGGLGVGVAVPTTRLHISGATPGDSGLRLETLTSVTPVSLGQAIGVDGNGNIVTINNVSGSTGPRPITTVIADTTLTDLDQVVIVNSTTPITITLPQITISGRFITIKNVNIGTETILAYSGQLIDGDTSVVVARKNVSLDFQSYNNNWYII